MRYLLVVFLLLSGWASAQSVSYTAYVNAQLPNNTSRAITPANVRNSVLAFPNNIYVDSAFPISTTSYVSASTYYGDGSHLTGISGGGTSPSWYAIQNIPLVIQNISNSTGSVTVTSINAPTGTFTTMGVGSLTASGIVSANTLDAFFISGTQVAGTTGLFTGGLTVGNVTSNVVVAAGNVIATGTVSASALNGLNISGTSGFINSLTVGSCTGCAGAATAGGPNTSIQYNSGTALAGSSAFTVASGTTTMVASISGTISATQALNTVAVSAVTVNGTLQTAAQPNVTSVGTLTGLTVNGTLSATTSLFASATILAGSSLSSSVINAGQISATNISATGTISASIYGIDITRTASASEVLYVSGTRMDGALGICYDRVQNFTYLGVPNGGSCPAPNTVSTTLQISGTTTTNNMREGIGSLSASTSTTIINMGLTTMVSMSIVTNTTISTSNVNNAQANVVVVKSAQDGTGGRVITWPTNARFSANTSPTINTTANTFSLFTLTPVPGSSNILVTMPATGVSN